MLRRKFSRIPFQAQPSTSRSKQVRIVRRDAAGAEAAVTRMAESGWESRPRRFWDSRRPLACRLRARARCSKAIGNLQRVLILWLPIDAFAAEGISFVF